MLNHHVFATKSNWIEKSHGIDSSVDNLKTQYVELLKAAFDSNHLFYG